MKVCFYCGYYPDRAHKLKKRTEDYWNSYFYVWAVKVGSHKKDFYILQPGKVQITKANFLSVRKTFGTWAAAQIAAFSDQPLIVVPVPSKDGLVAAGEYRSLKMVREAFWGTAYKTRVVDALRWNTESAKAHEGGSRKRDDMLPLLDTVAIVKDKSVVLVDELFSTGGSLLASADRLTASGATVLGAVTCGRTVYDFNTPAFGPQEFDLTTELADWPAQAGQLPF